MESRMEMPWMWIDLMPIDALCYRSSLRGEAWLVGGTRK